MFFSYLDADFVFFYFRRSSDSNGSFLSKMAKAEVGNITKINNALPILEVVNDGTSSVCIKSTSTATVDRTCPDVKPKVVKLNRGTLGLNLNKSVDEAVKRNKSTGYRHTEDKLTSQVMFLFIISLPLYQSRQI